MISKAVENGETFPLAGAIGDLDGVAIGEPSSLLGVFGTPGLSTRVTSSVSCRRRLAIWEVSIDAIISVNVLLFDSTTTTVTYAKRLVDMTDCRAKDWYRIDGEGCSSSQQLVSVHRPRCPG